MYFISYACFCWFFKECIYVVNCSCSVPAISHLFLLVICCALAIFHIFFSTVFACFLSLELWYWLTNWKSSLDQKRGCFSFVTLDGGRVQCVHVWSNCLHIYELFSVWTTNNQQATTASCNRPLIALEIHSTMALKNAHMRIPKGGIWSLQMQPFFHCSMPTLLLIVFDTVPEYF